MVFSIKRPPSIDGSSEARRQAGRQTANSKVKLQLSVKLTPVRVLAAATWAGVSTLPYCRSGSALRVGVCKWICIIYAALSVAIIKLFD